MYEILIPSIIAAIKNKTIEIIENMNAIRMNVVAVESSCSFASYMEDNHTEVADLRVADRDYCSKEDFEGCSGKEVVMNSPVVFVLEMDCLLYTSDAADE